MERDGGIESDQQVVISNECEEQSRPGLGQ